jgi:hypothetical protein
MKKHIFPYFGELNCSRLEEHYDAEWEVGDFEIDLDLNFEHKTIDQDCIDNIQYFLEQIQTYDVQNQAYILNDFEKNPTGTVKEYLEFHLGELEKSTLETLIHFDNKEISLDQQLLQHLKLHRIGLYPDRKYGTSCFAIFDYSISKDITNLLVVLTTNEKGEVLEIVMES